MSHVITCDGCGNHPIRHHTLSRGLAPTFHFCDLTCLRAWATKPPDEEASG